MKRKFNPLLSKPLVFSLLLLFLATGAQAQFTVSGNLKRPNDEPMSGFPVVVMGTENKVVYTDGNGNYSFSLQGGGAYNIRPLSCNESPLNGVSTYDMVLIARHLDGTEPLNTPYKIIAADVDNSGSVDAQDTSIVRSLILGIITEFPISNFHFVLVDYVFPDPLDPFNPPFPVSYSISNLQSDVENVDFIGVKKGDVNNTSVGSFDCSSPDLPARIIGKVFRDEDSDCQPDSNEAGMQGWKVSASDGTSTFYATTNSAGEYEIETLIGTFDVVLSNPEGLWGGCPDTVFGVQVSPPNFGVVDFGLQPQELCPSMQVDLSNGLLRRCFSNIYQVQYCNTGTVTAENARIEVDFDPYFEVQTSTFPWSEVNGNTYTFELGDVPFGDCGNFWVTFVLSCDATIGQTHCSEARIFPDTACSAPFGWNGPVIKVKGSCAGDEVKFVISNLGANMAIPSNYIVVEDIVVMAPPINNPFTLMSQESEVITLPANGATWRLEAEQAPGYPWGTVASAAVEGCGTNASGDFSRGFVNQFPQDDQSPIVDIDCRENIGSFDPNDKQGFPLGVLAEHYIPLEQPIDYLIRFQNTGTDTAFTVVVRDTLDAALDIKSIRPLGSSHPYSFSLIGQNVAQFTFANILLPDSNVNEAASHGFVKFSISPKKGLPNGTEVKNRAAIFFDFNAPVLTNTTLHTLGDKYLNVSNIVFRPGIGLEVFPNPVTESATFLLKSPSPIRGILSLFDTKGKLVAEQKFDHNQFDFSCHSLQAGYYFFKISSAGQPVAAGKLVKVDK